MWSGCWQNKTIQVWCDNEAVVAIVNKGTANDKECMHLVRCLAFLKVIFSIEMVASHIQGKQNILADALSRNDMNKFHTLHPQADRMSTEIPTSLLDVLLVQKPDWMSHRLAELWTSIFTTV